MRIEQLDYFLTIARYGSISQAANNLYIGQPTLSAAINSLEKELDIKLFKRTKAGMELTPIGQELIPLAETAVADFYAIKKRATKKIVVKSHIHLACDASASYLTIEQIISRCKAQFPTINLHIHEMLPAEVLRFVVEGNATIGIGSVADYILPKHQEYADDLNLFIKPLLHDEICFCCHTQHPMASAAAVSFHDILDEAALIPEGLVYQGIFKTPHAYQEINNLCTFSNPETIKSLLINGQFIALLPQRLVQNDPHFQKDGLLKALPLINHDNHYLQYLTYCKEHPLSEIEQYLLDLIESVYQELSPKCIC